MYWHLGGNRKNALDLEIATDRIQIMTLTCDVAHWLPIYDEKHSCTEKWL